MKVFYKSFFKLGCVLLMLGTFHSQLNAQGATCATATSVSCPQTISGSTVGLTAQPVITCGTTLNTAGGQWFTTNGTGGLVTVTTCFAVGFDTKIGVFSGTCGSLVCVAGNDDAACSFSALRSTVSFNSVAGTTYFIYITGFSTNTGAYTMSVTGACGPAGPPPPPPPPPGPANDLCANRASISCGGSVMGTTVNATVDNAGTCTTTNTAPGVWYSFMGNNSILTLNTCGSAFDTKLSVYTGPCGSFTCVAGNDDFCSLQSQVTFFAATGTEYFILVHGFSSATGAFTLNASCVACPFPVQAPWTATAINGSVMTSQVECNGSITASGTGVGSATADRLSFIHQTLSGNGYITARLNSFTNWAYGGVQFRGDLTAGAIKVGLSTQLGSRASVEARSTANTAHTVRNVAAPKHTWIRLARNGNVFTSFVSADGTTWTQVDQRTVTLPTVANVGIYVYSQLASSGTVNFSNVTVTSGLPLQNEGISNRNQENEINVPLAVFPNPVASDLNIKMGSLEGETVEFVIYNILGQVVFNQEVQQAVEVEKLNVSQLTTGVYMLQVNNNNPVKFIVDK